MKDELKFSEIALKEFSNVHSSNQEFKEQLNLILQAFSKKNLKKITAKARGNGDCGGISTIKLTLEDGTVDRYLEDDRQFYDTLCSICETLAETFVFGYEINDGGGFEVEFTKNGSVIDLQMEGFYNVVQAEQTYWFASKTEE